MTETKHTPTPWETSSNEHNQWDVCAVNGGDMIADLSNCDNDEANAAFIVRCVNSHDALVKALEAALIIAESAYHDDIEAGEKDAAEICLETVEQARAALAQAKGDA